MAASSAPEPCFTVSEVSAWGSGADFLENGVAWAAPWLTGAWWALIVLRGSLPALFSVVVAGVVAAVATQDPYIKVSEVCVPRLVISWKVGHAAQGE